MSRVHAKSHEIFMKSKVKLRDVSCHFCVFTAQMLFRFPTAAAHCVCVGVFFKFQYVPNLAFLL
jgi:hypothetical protein